MVIDPLTSVEKGVAGWRISRIKKGVETPGLRLDPLANAFPQNFQVVATKMKQLKTSTLEVGFTSAIGSEVAGGY